MIKETIESDEPTKLAFLLDDMAMEENSIHKAFGDESIENSKEYGLTEKTPLCTRHAILGKAFIQRLTFQGELIKIGEVEELWVDFGRLMTETGNHTNVLAYQILNKNGEKLDTIYIFYRCYHENLKAPIGYEFKKRRENSKIQVQ